MPSATSKPPTKPSSKSLEGHSAEWYLEFDHRRWVRAVRIVIRSFMWWFRLRAYGVENVPATGAVLMCPNHSSYLDPFLHVVRQKRLVRFMAKASLFRVPVFRHLPPCGGAFPVRRGESDDGALDLAAEYLRRGQALVIYPEGTRCREIDGLGTPRSGAARLVLQERVPVMPIAARGLKPRAVHGRSWWPPLGKVTILYGEPMHFDTLENTPENVERVRDEVWAEVARLYDLARQLDERRFRPRKWSIPPRDAGPAL